ncbi:MAG: class I SAM-dependent methyltransferase [Rhodanobacteraceae bacterium]|nr:class I SAM-dependent methyltransferase [Rhodanobacteraceae bacterium]
MYGFHEYGNMIRDRVRTEAYKEAIDRTLTPESVVLDLGAGTGAFALYAAIRGARKVYAVETSPLIEYGRREALRLGLEDRIEFFHGASEDFHPSERANLLISDLRGALPFLGGAFATLADARARLLTQDAVLLPRRDSLWVAPVSDAGWYSRQIETPWVENALGLSLPVLREAEGSAPRRPPPTGLEPALPGQRFGVIDYAAASQALQPADLTWEVPSATTLHAWLMWFDSELTQGVSMSAAPGARAPWVYGRLVLPLSRPLELAAGDTLRLRISVWPVAGDFAYTWRTQVADSQGTCKAELSQNSAAELFLASRSCAS